MNSFAGGNSSATRSGSRVVSGVASPLVILSALLSFAGIGLAAQEDRIRGPVENSRYVPLQGSIHPKARLANDGGALEPGIRINGVKLVLAQSDVQRDGLDRFLEEQRDPSSGDYQNWLTPEQYGERFGLSENDLAGIGSWLQSRGFAIEQVARARNYITFNGTAEQIARTFRTELHHVDIDGEAHFANVTAPWIPATLAGVVHEIRGLNDFRPKPQRVKTILRPELNATNGFHYLGPDDLAVIYDIKALYGAGFDGTGQKIAIPGQTDVKLADLRAFRTQFNLPAKDPQMVQAGADPGANQNDQLEADLDLEWSGAVARNATIIYVYSPDVFESLQYAIDQNLAPVVSLSYGGCELEGSTSFRTLAQQANAQGITWMNASGDSAAAGCDSGLVATHGPAATFPADIPEVTAVGGTEFNETGGSYWSPQNGVNFKSALSYIPEKAWNDTPLGSGLAAGGGAPSLVYTKPSWQTGPGVPNDHARDVPDISLAASGAHDGYVIYASGGLMAVGGTSAASPSFAGIVSILNQYLTAKGAISKPGLGNINPALYNLAQNTTGLFHDITSGNNIVPCATGSKGCVNGSFGYNAGPGYDLTTGLGSVDAFNLVTKWTSLPPAVGTTLTLAAAPATIAASATVQLTATVAAVSGASTPTGAVTFATGSATLGSATLTGSGPAATAVLAVKGASLAAGANPIAASYAATGNFNNSTGSVSVIVTAPLAATATTATATPVNIAASGTAQITATVRALAGTGRPAGTVTFSIGNKTIGTAALSNSNAAASLAVQGSSLATGSNSIVATYGGNSNFNGSASAPVVVIVAPPAIVTSTAVTASPAAIVQSSATVLTATVKAASGAPAGNVSFTIGNTLLGNAAVAVSGSAGTAVLAVKGSSLAVGNDDITANYTFTGNFTNSSSSVTVSVTPPPVATTTTLSASPGARSAATIVLTATVKAATGSAIPTGSVTFALGNTVLGSVTVAGFGIGAAAALTVNAGSLAAGNNTITATYSGNAGLGGSRASMTVSVASPQHVTLVATTTLIAPIALSMPATGTTQLTVIVHPATGGVPPSGTVAFTLGSTLLGTATLTGSAVAAAASATFDLKGNTLAVGNNVIVASYGGSSTFAASSASVTVTTH